MSQVLQFAILGLATGAMYALSGLGLVVTNRASGVVNFAHAAVGMFGTFVFWDLNQNHGVAWPLAALAGVATSAALSGLIQQLLMRPLRDSAPVVRMVATLGALTLIEQLAAHLWTSQTVLVPSDLPTSAVTVAGAIVGADKIIIFGVAAVLTIGLGLVSRFTNFGRATSAAAENHRAAAALGYSPNAIGLGNWLIGGALSGIAGILLAPILQLQIDQYTLLIIPTLAAAVVGRLASLPVTFVGGLVLGIAQSEISRYVSQPGWPDAVPFLLVAVVLVARGNDRSFRSRIAERLPDVGSGRVLLRVVVPALIVAVVIANVIGSTWASALTVTMIAAIIVLSVVVVTGYSGQLSLAQYALAAWAAWVAARVASATGWSLLPTLVIGVLLTLPLGLLVGVLCLRTRGVYLAIATLAFSSALQALILNDQGLTGGVTGIVVPVAHVFGIDVDSVNQPGRYAVVTILAFTACAIAVANIRRGGSGRRMLAVRANDRAAASLGIGTVTAKLYAFVVASGIAAVGGILLNFTDTTVTFTNYSPLESIQVVQQAVVAGAGWIGGSLNGGLLQSGSLVSTILNEVSNGWAGYLPVIGAILVIFAVLAMPDGLASRQWQDIRRIASRMTRGRRAAPATPAVVGGDIAPKASPKRLEVSGLTVAFGGTVAVDDMTLTVEPGSVTGLIGPNGAGKTTLIDAITGYVPARSGQIRVSGRDITRMSPARIARAGVTRSFQSLELFEDMTVLDNLRAASEGAGSILSYLTDIVYPRRRPLGSAALAAIRDFGLESELGKKPKDVSFGTRRLVGIARAVATGASVLLLDEPAAGLSDQETAELGTLVRDLAQRWGVGVLIIEHNVQMIMDICDDVYVLNFGRVVSHGSAHHVRNDPEVIAAYLGTSSGQDVTAEKSAISGSSQGD